MLILLPPRSTGSVHSAVVKAAANLFGVVEVGEVEPGGGLRGHERLAPPKTEDAWLDHDVYHVEGEGQLLHLIIGEKYRTYTDNTTELLNSECCTSSEIHIRDFNNSIILHIYIPKG